MSKHTPSFQHTPSWRRGRRRDLARERLWRGLLRQYAGSGQSIRAFCAARRLPESAFYFWRAELRRRRLERDRPAGGTRRPDPPTTGRPGAPQRHTATPVGVQGGPGRGLQRDQNPSTFTPPAGRSHGPGRRRPDAPLAFTPVVLRSPEPAAHARHAGRPAAARTAAWPRLEAGTHERHPGGRLPAPRHQQPARVGRRPCGLSASGSAAGATLRLVLGGGRELHLPATLAPSRVARILLALEAGAGGVA
jgi:hypothetical protein